MAVVRCLCRPLAAPAVALAFAAACTAQPALSVSPDTLVGEVRLLNVGTDPLRLDSLRVDACDTAPPGPCGYGYTALLQSGDLFIDRYILPAVDDTVPLFTGQTEIVLAPGDSAILAMGPVDPCPICAMAPSSWDHVIALDIWAGGEALPVTIAYAFDIPVRTGTSPSTPETTLSVEGPNPFRTTTHLVLRLAAASTVDVSIQDALGRRVGHVFHGTLPAGSHRLAVDATGFAPGLFFVRAGLGAGRRADLAVVPLVFVR